jgi:hypothetical protein
MALTARSFVWIALICGCAIASAAEQNGPALQQSSPKRHDPATDGAGPTSRAPGETDYDAPKGAPVTTDDRGVTTTNSSSGGSTGDGVRRDQGNESYDAIPDGK